MGSHQPSRLAYHHCQTGPFTPCPRGLVEFSILHPRYSKDCGCHRLLSPHEDRMINEDGVNRVWRKVDFASATILAHERHTGQTVMLVAI